MADPFTDIMLPFVGTALMLSIWSWLYRESKFYHFAEATTVGVSVGNAIVVGIGTLTRMSQPLMTGSISVALALLLGALLFTRFSRQYSWVSIYPMALIIGIGTGLFLTGYIQSSIVKQILATIPLFSGGNINDFIVGISVLLVMSYFIYTMTGSAGKALTTTGKVGRLILMTAIGALFGQSAFTRLSRVIVVVQDIMFVKPDASKWAVAVTVIVIAYDAISSKYKSLTKPTSE